MRDFLKIMEKDIQSENFTKREPYVYGIIAPVALVVILGIAGWLGTF